MIDTEPPPGAVPRARWFGPLAELLRFVRAPRTPLPPLAGRRAALNFYGRLLVLIWLFNLAWLLLTFGVKDAAGAEHMEFGAPTLGLLFALAVWVPVLEELTFRSWLKRCAYLPLIAMFLFVRWLVPDLLKAIQVTAVLLSALGLLARRERLLAVQARGDALLARAFPLLLHMSTIGFAFAHTVNWNVAPGQLWVVPLLVVPQLVLGYALAYARVRSGLAAAIALHGTSNAFVWLVLWLSTLADDMP